jgi:formylglycine-generating enzyme required for sulfatase activity
MSRYILPIALTVLVSSTASAQQDAPVLVKVVTNDREIVVGELGRESDTHIEVLAIQTGKPRTFQKTDLQLVRKNINEEEATTAVGLPLLLAWKMKKVVPAVESAVSKRSIAILPLVDGDGKETAVGKLFAEELTTGLVNRGISVVERTLLDKVRGELGMQQSVLFDATQAQKAGKQLGAFAILTGTILPKMRYAEVQLRLVNVETGEILVATSQKMTSTGPVQKASQPSMPSLPTTAPLLAVAPFDEKTAKRHQAAWAKHLGVPVEMTNSIGMRFVLIPPGEFDMGSTEADVARLLEQAKATKQLQWYIDQLPAEAPKHRVRITKPFYLGRCEVTQAQYERVVGSNPSKIKDDPQGPVETVSWNDVSEFCRKLGELPQEQGTRAEYRLPTEAEWEYACRAGTTTLWYSGDAEGALKEHAWFGETSAGKTRPVGKKSPNAWGLYDMHGNVWEWCQDWWSDRYDTTSPMDDPLGASGGWHRVMRGGSWDNSASQTRASYRSKYGPGGRFEYLGYRLARTVASR